MAEPPRRPRRPRRQPADPPGREAALEIALRFLGSRPRTRSELARRLRSAGAADDVVASVLERLQALGYVDDDAFVRWWVEQRDRHAPRGGRMIEAELRQHGVAQEAIEAFRTRDVRADRAPEDESLPTTERERARSALDRHLKGRPLPSDPRAVQRIGMFLMRRGFDSETVRATLRQSGASDDADG